MPNKEFTEARINIIKELVNESNDAKVNSMISQLEKIVNKFKRKKEEIILHATNRTILHFQNEHNY